MQIKSLVQKTISVRRYDEPLNKYVYLNDLLCTNERLFYKLLSENVEELMPIVYTPTVGLACQKFGYIFSKPQVNHSMARANRNNHKSSNVNIKVVFLS